MSEGKKAPFENAIKHAVYSSNCNTNNIKVMKMRIFKVKSGTVPHSLNMSPRPRSPPKAFKDSCEVDDDENVQESFRENMKPLISNFNRPREEIKDPCYKNYSQKSSTPNSKNISFAEEIFKKVEHDSASLGDANEMGSQSFRKGFLEYDYRVKGESINLSHKNLYEVNHKDFGTSRIISINLQNNRITRIPTLNTPNLKYLNTLRLDNNLIRKFPSQIFECVVLETLSLNNCQIMYIPSGIKECGHLQTFHINKNPIRYISSNIRYCTSLREISLDWISYLNYDSKRDHSKIEEDQDKEIWRIVKSVLFYNIEEIIAGYNPTQTHFDPDLEMIQKQLSEQNSEHGDDIVDSISFELFLVEAYKLKFQQKSVDLAHVRLKNNWNLLHMAVELDHLYYIRVFSALKVSFTEIDLALNTPFRLGIHKSKAMRSLLLKIMQEKGVSAMQSFGLMESSLKICLDKGDLDCAHMLVKDNTFIADLLNQIDEDYKRTRCTHYLLISCFKVYGKSPIKAADITDVILNILGGDVLSTLDDTTPILEACRVSKFSCVKYILEKKLVDNWQELVDQFGKNIFHYTCEFDEFDLTKNIIEDIMINQDPYKALGSMILKHCSSQGLTPKLYADPHRVICKYIVKIEKLVLKHTINLRKEEVKNSLKIQDIHVGTVCSKQYQKLVQKKANFRQWKNFKVQEKQVMFKNYLTNQLDAVELKRRGVSTNEKRVYQNLASRLKTPKRIDPILIKRSSLFNENTRRPVNTLTAPKKGDNTDSISPVNSEDGAVGLQKYSNDKRNNKFFTQNRTLKSFSTLRNPKDYLKFGKKPHSNPYKGRDPSSKREDSSPSINSERKDFSFNRQRMSQKHFEKLQKSRKNTMIHPSSPSRNYLDNIQCKESSDYGKNEDSQSSHKVSSKLQRKSRAIFPPDIRRVRNADEIEVNKQLSHAKRPRTSKNDLSNYNEDQMSERMANTSPINREMPSKLYLKLDKFNEKIFATPAISANSDRSAESKELFTNEKPKRLVMSSFKMYNHPSLPESTQVKSQYKVFKGSINRSHTFMGNKFTKSEKKCRRNPILTEKYLDLMQEDFTGKEGEIQGVIQKGKDYKTFKMKSKLKTTSHQLKKRNSKCKRTNKGDFKFLVRDDACLNDKELNLSNAINHPIPGLVIKSQFKKSIEVKKEFGQKKLIKQKIRDNYITPKMKVNKTFPNREYNFINNPGVPNYVNNEPKRQQLMHIRPHLRCRQ
ncbi:unnamed protein product [Moneuplotes crassus]|uniref:Uncharacterized protein n=2 Tax=Euplotes crassus TaxID=5936 RepID=A0AAD1XEE6_EUPCR|nr:unnamed protein product [Moneuplotes crassus]